MSTRQRRRKSGVPDLVGGRLFGGSRRTARDFISVVGLVFAIVAVLVLQTWQRIEVVETMQENDRLSGALSRLSDRAVCREMTLERRTARGRIVERAGAELGLRAPAWTEVFFVADSTSSRSPWAGRPARRGFEGGGGP